MTRTARSLGQFLLLLCVFALVLSFPAQVDATGSCNASQVEVLYNGNTVTGSIKSGQNCSAYGYVKKYTCDGNVSVCNTNEQTIAQGNLPVSGTANPPCGKTVQIDVDMYQAQAWQGHLGGGGIARYGGACPSPTPKPTPKPTPTPTPTPKPSPSPSPTPRPTPSPTPTPVCVIDKLKVEPYPNPSDWVRTGEFKITNTGNFSMTFSWFLDIWGTSTGDKRGTQTLEPGASVTLGLGKICSKWQLDLECAGRERGFVIEPQACTTPTPTPTPTPKPSPSPSPTPRPTPSPTPTPRSCNYSCSSNSDCQSGLVCYQDGNSKYCRHPDNPGNSSCDTRKTGGFFIRKYHDEDGDGYQDSSEKGLSWKFQWDSNADNNWRDYETFSDKLGEGGVVNLPEGTQVRIREKAVDGWTATTPTEVTIRIRSGENQLMVFGNWRGKPSVLGTTTTRVLPATGGSLVIGGIGSIVMYGVGLWMKRKGL